ncbi:hypothetical protein LshimejAT787_0300100 [Lyophyllum shimeji]|uniref:Uncharacterized protein n=1 Tax=Lyophyllum shimeji TaxID=47721 RepID=A0A9P3PGN6_LYOSH|nr:hypothetical protein LshimejAT787_0300100 [Lyophyllum shimeji]
MHPVAGLDGTTECPVVVKWVTGAGNGTFQGKSERFYWLLPESVRGPIDTRQLLLGIFLHRACNNDDSDDYDDDEHGTSKSPRSLIISPNLDALLEYDEKVRGAWSPTAPHSAPVGLPPPPRRNSRKPRTPTSPKIGSPLIQETSPTWEASGNPYINPAPTLAVVVEAEDDKSRDGTGPEPADGGTRSEGRNRDDLQQPSNISQPSQISKNRVDKLLGIGKLPFALFQETTAAAAKSPSGELNDVSNTPARRHSQSVLNLRERARAKGKLLKISSHPVGGDSNQSPQMRQGDDQLVLDIRRPSEPETMTQGVSTPPDSDDERRLDTFQRRPLLSHGSRRQSSSSSSSSTTTTTAPASTIDMRVSISSTIYPASSALSHAHDMYSVDPVPIVPPNRSSSLQQTSRPADRQSFIDILSPTGPEFVLPELYHHRTRSTPPSRTSSPKPGASPKPPIPTAPKPIFNRSSPKTSPQQRYEDPKLFSDKLPPTTNFLDLEERSDLIKKNRKLAKVFGQPPGADALAQQQDAGRSNKPPFLLPISSNNSRHQRGALSVSNNLVNAETDWQPASEYISILGRRHSAPLSPDHLSFLKENKELTKSSRSPDADIHAPGEISVPSPTSFIDLSDDLGSATLEVATPKEAAPTRGRRPSSPSAQSLFENMTPEEQAEETRRRKREKLAKVHRFLGSRVPANLVLDLEDVEASLPPLDPAMAAMPTLHENEDATRKVWLRRRRSSSAAPYRSSWSDEVDRIKEDLNYREKAINVRRAQKMEKVFGVAPPQTLYHTRRSPSPSVPNAALASNKFVSGWTSPGESLAPVTGLRNPNRSSYAKPKKSKDNRPGTSESNKALLPKGRSESPEPPVRKRTSVYTHYHESLNSLNDIIDRDDRESLAELHEYITSLDMSEPPPLQSFTRTPTTIPSGERRLSNASSIKSERRRSLPARTSVISLSSEYSITTPRPEVTDFQARRRRAAKLTQFFGVDYRELITDVLESIENGLEHERKRGTLKPDEVEDLLSRLRNLRTKRSGFF